MLGARLAGHRFFSHGAGSAATGRVVTIEGVLIVKSLLVGVSRHDNVDGKEFAAELKVDAGTLSYWKYKLRNQTAQPERAANSIGSFPATAVRPVSSQSRAAHTMIQ